MSIASQAEPPTLKAKILAAIDRKMVRNDLDNAKAKMKRG